MHDDACGEAFGPDRQNIHEGTEAECAEPIRPVMHQHEGDRGDHKGAPGVASEGNLLEVLALRLHIAHEKAAPEDFLGKWNNQNHADEAHDHGCGEPESMVAKEAGIETQASWRQPEPHGPGWQAHVGGGELLPEECGQAPPENAHGGKKHREPEATKRSERVVPPANPQEHADDASLQWIDPLLRSAPPPW